MKDSIKSKLDSLSERYEELEFLLSNQDVINDQNKFRSLSKEYSELEQIVHSYRNYKKSFEDLENARILIKDPDFEIRSLAQIEYEENKKKLMELDNDLNLLLLPKDPNDDKNIFLEIRAGTGGDEAAIFAGDLFRMYSRYAESQNWKIELISENIGEHGGYKEIICRIIGQGVYSKLKFESGAHRVQRVPTTESQGRIHTSACTVAVMPEIEEIDSIDIDQKDLRIDTYRASGAGGQHVNKTDSAVRITHIPTGIVAECQEERSQHKNKLKAMSLLQSKILSQEQEKQKAEQALNRRNLVGSGDRSERIRTYNFPQGRVTDHRINLTLYKLDEIISGNLSYIVDQLLKEHQMDQLSSLNEVN